MKRIIFIISLLFLGITCFSQQWSLLGFSDQRITAVAVHPQNPDIIFCAGMGIYKSNDGGISWDTVSLYPGFNSIIFYPNSINTDLMYATLGIGSLSDGIYKTIDGGNTWDILAWMPGVTSVIIPEGIPGTMLAGTLGTGVLESTDSGNTWTQLNDSLDNLNVLSLAVFYPVCIPEDPITEYLAGTYGGVFYYPDHVLLTSQDEYWRNTNTAVNAKVPALSSTPNSSCIWSVIGGGSWSDGMYKSTDYGMTWNVSEYWPFMTDILINSLNPLTVYAADSGSGVKRTMNNGLTWQTINTGLGDSIVYCLGQSLVDTLRLYAGTEHGLYVYGLSTGTEELEDSQDHNITFYPSPASDKITIDIIDSKKTRVDLVNTEGRVVKRLILQSSGTVDIADLESGLYLLKFYTEKTVITKKLIKQ